MHILLGAVSVGFAELCYSLPQVIWELFDDVFEAWDTVTKGGSHYADRFPHGTFKLLKCLCVLVVEAMKDIGAGVNGGVFNEEISELALLIFIFKTHQTWYLLWWRLQVDQDIGCEPHKHYGTNQVNPNIHSLILHHKKWLKDSEVCVEVDSVSSVDVFIQNLPWLCLADVPNERFVVSSNYVLFFLH